MGRRNRPRSSQLPAPRQGYPELRAYHRLVDGPELDFFFGELQRLLPEVIDPATATTRSSREVEVPQFRLYSDPEKNDITILERRLTRRHAKKNRIQWNPNDVGRVTGEIQDEVGRLGLSGQVLTVEFTGVVRLGNLGRDSSDARKLGLIAEQRSPESEFLVREHELSMEALTRNLRQFKYPYSTFIPHFTFGKVFRVVPEAQIGAAIEVVQDQLPLTVDIHPISFSAWQEVGTRS